MANIWRKDDNFVDQPSRNVFDLSFQNNLTMKFGALYPVFCKEVIPGDSFSIEPTFALKFQPMVFPIQTRMKAYLHFFKVRNRNLWKDFPDFIGKNKDGLVPPYLDESVTQARTGKLLDYLGVPTTFTGSYGSDWSDSIPIVSGAEQGYYPYYLSGVINEVLTTPDSRLSYVTQSVGDKLKTTNANDISIDGIYTYVSDLPSDITNSCFWILDLSSVDSNSNSLRINVVYSGNSPVEPLTTNQMSSYASSYDYYPKEFSLLNSCCLVLYSSDGSVLRYYQNPTISEQQYILFSDIDFVDAVSARLYFPMTFNIGANQNNGPSVSQYAVREDLFYVNAESTNNVLQVRSFQYSVNQSATDTGVSVVSDIDDDSDPYYRSTATTDLRERIKLSALPCRAYESIYNSFYRNADNNPYLIDGVPEYNRWIPSQDGGIDKNLYELRYRNWEDDFLTTALPMPQAGIAPLVGLTGTAGTATVTMESEDGTTTATAEYDEDGTITSMSADGVAANALVDTVTYGISINDLRNVNSFQRWLERKARGGYKYRDQIKAQYGVTVRYDELDMPEFLGGMSLPVMVNQISQTVSTETSPLGDYAGQASCVGSGERINEYIDEHGFIIGILSVVPVPNYSQLLPKHFIKQDAFDYFFPEFGHIGMQPINYDEVCPIQAYSESSETDDVLQDVFGYQRAWYDYLGSTDEVHGEFRTNMRNFVMNRYFNVKPELSESFLLVDPTQLNDVFAITSNDYDKILGQIYFDVKAKRPIPLYGIPKLE